MNWTATRDIVGCQGGNLHVLSVASRVARGSVSWFMLYTRHVDDFKIESESLFYKSLEPRVLHFIQVFIAEYCKERHVVNC